MKTLIASLALMLAFMAPTTYAQGNAGKVFGAGVQCTFSDGMVKQLPRELCKAYGGQSH